MANNIFTKSNFFKSEYCCSIIKVGEVKPIEGKDKIGYTLVNGETIVVRKDQVKEGDVLLYASNETQLNKDFLGANNLFEISSYELNANAKEVEPYILKNKELKTHAEYLEHIVKKLKDCSAFILSYDTEIMSVSDDENQIKELNERLVNVLKNAVSFSEGTLSITSPHTEFIKTINEKLTEKNIELNRTKNQIEKNTDFIRSHVGFFNKTGRVKAIKLGGVRSMGYLFSIDELVKYNPNLKDINLEELIGEDFDTVDGELFVKAYVPFVPEQRKRSKAEKRNKNIEKFDRMIKGEFSYHYDTNPLAKNINKIHPTDCVSISYKLHGTSLICGKIHVKTPIKLPIHKWLWNKFVDLTHLFKSCRFTDYVVEYGNVTSSRTTIKNQYINKGVGSGYYDVDIWSEYGNLIYPYLDEGMIIYGEICGYLTGSDKMIQKGYDYGCDKGENFLMIYRITTSNGDGSKREWNVSEVKEWTEKLIENHPELSAKVRVIDLLYHGTLMELYPKLSLTNHWHENVLEELRNDKKNFFMEKNCFICKNKVPAEGIVLRIDDDEFAEAFKLKSYKFLKKESELMDEIANGKEKLNDEMLETYGN